MPTSPARCTWATNSSSPSSRQGIGDSSSRWLANGSASISIASASRPLGWWAGPTDPILPLAGLWRVDETKPPGSAITCPRATRSPTRTTGRAGAPACWLRGIR